MADQGCRDDFGGQQQIHSSIQFLCRNETLTYGTIIENGEGSLEKIVTGGGGTAGPEIKLPQWSHQLSKVLEL